MAMTWKARLGAMLVAAAATLGLGGTASAQDYTFGWNPRSGDVWVDRPRLEIVADRPGERAEELLVMIGPETG